MRVANVDQEQSLTTQTKNCQSLLPKEIIDSELQFAHGVIEVFGSSVANPKFWEGKKCGGKILDFRLATVFCMGYRLSKHKMTIYSKTLGGGHGPVGPPGYAYGLWHRAELYIGNHWPKVLKKRCIFLIVLQMRAGRCPAMTKATKLGVNQWKQDEGQAMRSRAQQPGGLQVTSKTSRAAQNEPSK